MVQSVERTLSILELLGHYPNGLSITAVAKELNLAKSTAHRLLSTLMARGYVQQDSHSGYYCLGTQCLVLASNLLNNLDIRSVAKDALHSLSSSTEEVVHLCIEDKNEVVYIDKVESNQTLRMYSQIGRRAYMHCTGVGKVLLSDFNVDQLDQLIKEKGLPIFTENTITDRKRLLDELALIKERGYAIDEEEHEKGIRCIAAPIRDYEGSIIAAISIAGPIERVTRARVKGALAKEIIKQSCNISNKLGYIQK
ncbi:transcriptional regulator [Gracilibacillus boraciitolerans JCM 21714]|uniref:Glycerol operon regulatory protein n=1 Tax=Gracilibacillus boraciitolerans JCM 21714 TaxID=1298598 RepID=W4VFQ0_9BACI|nr:IclR family transcriptional regulator [Gracilibacillus boraciitolerans]GAE92235.1 transcriptional regulator [Gracilibacillus boraciitolerans JCM 21714]